MTRRYNVAGQLVQQVEKESDGNLLRQVDFSYDAAGNILKEQKLPKPESVSLPAVTMTYSAANRLATYNGQAVQFDADGNLLVGPLAGEMTNFSFDSRNRLVAAGPTSYRYDAENQRIWVNQTSYVINSQPALSQVLVKDENGVKTFYVYGLGLIGEEKEGEYRSYHFDFRGSTVVITDQTGKVVERFQYGPYGELLKGEASVTPFLFNGKFGVMTDSNGLSYMRARFYSAVIKRFVNMDVLLGSVGEGQTLNRYAFVTGRPVNFVDPFGLEKTTGNCAIGAYDCLIYGLNNPEMRNFGEQLLEITPGDLVEKLWVCSRRVNALYGWFLPNHKYVCCDGPNLNCYGHQQNNLIPGKEIPHEGNPTTRCEMRKVTIQNKKAHCESPKSPCKANTLTWNCRNWAEWDGKSECPIWTEW